MIRSACDYVAPLISRTLLKNKPFDDPLRNKKSKEKFTSQFWQTTMHVVLGLVEVRELAKVDFKWLFRPSSAFYPYPDDANIPESLKTVYIIQLAIWIVTCYSHRFIEEKHKDYFLMYVHHLVTIGLIFGSYLADQTRIGIVVLFIHDISDIPIDCLKLSNYLKLEERKGFFIVEMCYALVMTSWPYMRLYLFPYYVIYRGVYTAMRPSMLTIDGERTLAVHVFEDFCDDDVAASNSLTSVADIQMFCRGCTPYWGALLVVGGPFFLTLLTALFLMHILWYKLLAGIGLKMLMGMDPHEAGRQDYEGADDEVSDAPQSTKKNI